MPLEVFIWNDVMIDHLDQHDVSPEDFEYVVQNRYEEERSRSTGRFAVRGFDPSGRYICCVYEREGAVILPWTAFSIDDDD